MCAVASAGAGPAQVGPPCTAGWWAAGVLGAPGGDSTNTWIGRPAPSRPAPAGPRCGARGSRRRPPASAAAAPRPARSRTRRSRRSRPASSAPPPGRRGRPARWRMVRARGRPAARCRHRRPGGAARGRCRPSRSAARRCRPPCPTKRSRPAVSAVPEPSPATHQIRQGSSALGGCGRRRRRRACHPRRTRSADPAGQLRALAHATAAESTTCTWVSGSRSLRSRGPRSARKPTAPAARVGPHHRRRPGTLGQPRGAASGRTRCTWRGWSSRPSPSIRQSSRCSTRTVGASVLSRSPRQHVRLLVGREHRQRAPSGIHSASSQAPLELGQPARVAPVQRQQQQLRDALLLAVGEKRELRPSGEKRGRQSLQAPCVSRRGLPPPESTSHRLLRSLPAPRCARCRRPCCRRGRGRSSSSAARAAGRRGEGAADWRRHGWEYVRFAPGAAR